MLRTTLNRKRALSTATRKLRRMVRPRTRRARVQKSMISLQNNRYNVHCYKRWAASDSFVATTGIGTAYSKLFAMSETINYGELVALYDQYKIMGVKMTFQLINNPDANTAPNSSTLASSTNYYPKLWYVRDYDDIGADTIVDLKQRNNVKCVTMLPNRIVSCYLRPATKGYTYLDGVTPGYSADWGKWIDCTNPTVPHYGVKFAIDFLGLTINQNWTIRCEYKYYLKFKNVR